ncbi:hypothetical protein PPL_08413 [Heterostelium album PN500]|uniref:CUE domain-containing protein n=1 Tax=Heterostelium pallidum (strain ATCC 26659 / Pp 5 / PN500) TaxID=670386 RepID=D3BI45_HETP5|nr:hypothetical protein PPL_08413 [Heterostelium album PN500]EFA78945.1 hypothetical protein PPL_08413 [Heterostelium album PN500]|eukprot:XP_020431069.1 hypothetical protein PPL_08413 [Heterostelium album PN500]
MNIYLVRERMSVPYEEALNSLQAMFSSFDRELIGAVLQQNKGHMEKTIDALLEMSGEVPINENTDSDHNIAQMHQDEMLARMLQNEMFVNEVRNDEQLAHLFNQRQLQQQRQRQQQQQQGLRPVQRDMAGSLPTTNSDTTHQNEEDGGSVLSMLEEDLNLKEIKEKINQLGEAAKTKFKELSDYFMKKEENNYQAVRTHDIDDEEEEEGRLDRHELRRVNTHQSSINSNNNTSINSSEDEYESFVLDDIGSRADPNTNGVRLRALREGSKEDD